MMFLDSVNQDTLPRETQSLEPDHSFVDLQKRVEELEVMNDRMKHEVESKDREVKEKDEEIQKLLVERTDFTREMIEIKGQRD